jgi:hypothetical protein
MAAHSRSAVITGPPRSGETGDPSISQDELQKCVVDGPSRRMDRRVMALRACPAMTAE